MKLILITLYAISVLVSYGALMADWAHFMGTKREQSTFKDYLVDAAISAAIALCPVLGLIIGIVGSGFCEHGFVFTYAQFECKSTEAAK